MNFPLSLRTPREVMVDCAKRARALRLELNITQAELAEQTGIAVGTVKRFEKTGEIQFHHLLRLALVLGRLDDFEEPFRQSPVPATLFTEEKTVKRQRARKK